MYKPTDRPEKVGRSTPELHVVQGNVLIMTKIIPPFLMKVKKGWSNIFWEWSQSYGFPDSNRKVCTNGISSRLQVKFSACKHSVPLLHLENSYYNRQYVHFCKIAIDLYRYGVKKDRHGFHLYLSVPGKKKKSWRFYVIVLDFQVCHLATWYDIRIPRIERIWQDRYFMGIALSHFKQTCPFVERILFPTEIDSWVNPNRKYKLSETGFHALAFSGCQQLIKTVGWPIDRKREFIRCESAAASCRNFRAFCQLWFSSYRLWYECNRIQTKLSGVAWGRNWSHQMKSQKWLIAGGGWWQRSTRPRRLLPRICIEHFPPCIRSIRYSFAVNSLKKSSAQKSVRDEHAPPSDSNPVYVCCSIYVGMFTSRTGCRMPDNVVRVHGLMLIGCMHVSQPPFEPTWSWGTIKTEQGALEEWYEP